MNHAIIDPLHLRDLEDWGPKPEPLGGSPAESGRVFAGGDDGPCEVGVWECTPGRWRITKDCDEFCCILKGHWRLTDDAGEVIDLRAGDSIFLPMGYSGIAEVVETVRKVYSIARRTAADTR